MNTVSASVWSKVLDGHMHAIIDEDFILKALPAHHSHCPRMRAMCLEAQLRSDNESATSRATRALCVRTQHNRVKQLAETVSHFTKQSAYNTIVVHAQNWPPSYVPENFVAQVRIAQKKQGYDVYGNVTSLYAFAALKPKYALFGDLPQAQCKLEWSARSVHDIRLYCSVWPQTSLHLLPSHL